MGLKRLQRFVGCLNIESLESRQMFSVVNVTPDNYVAAIAGSSNGDTISFAPGQYNLASGASVRLPGNRTYVGNGAVFQGGGDSVVNLGYTSNVDFSGFVLDGTEASADYSDKLNFHNNVVQNTTTDGGFVTTGMTNSSVDNNTFTNSNCGVYGYPLGGNQVDGNRFDYCIEPIHFSCYEPANGMDISGNVITHATRFGFELQISINNLTVTNNYMSDWLQQGSGGDDSHIGISCTTGGSGNAPYTDQGQNITISNNTLIQNGPTQNVDVWAKSAVEIMGYSGITMNNNYLWNWGYFILNGAYGGVNSNNNTLVGGWLYAPDNVAWPIGQITGSGDHIISLDGNSPPSPPAAGADIQSTPAPTPTPAPAPTPAPCTRACTRADPRPSACARADARASADAHRSACARANSSSCPRNNIDFNGNCHACANVEFHSRVHHRRFFATPGNRSDAYPASGSRHRAGYRDKLIRLQHWTYGADALNFDLDTRDTGGDCEGSENCTEKSRDSCCRREEESKASESRSNRDRRRQGGRNQSRPHREIGHRHDRGSHRGICKDLVRIRTRKFRRRIVAGPGTRAL